MTSEPGAVWEVMVNAQDLKPLSARNVAAYQNKPKGSIFHDDPIESTGNQNVKTGIPGFPRRLH